MNKDNLLQVLHTSFLGAIASNVRAIAFDYNIDTISIYTYIDKNPEEEDYEIIDMAITEVMASLPSILYQKIEIVETHEPIGKLKSYNGWIFVRYEE
ncbi:hypothetical protein ACFSX9_10755 [Flavobacterium ardleyense]|uniref:Uncharacterized protein n=1 Tax=Flavobacterium ardleyense TaxID=2038737 RepID=A0ABW5Z8Z9_9FLAO